MDLEQFLHEGSHKISRPIKANLLFYIGTGPSHARTK